MVGEFGSYVLLSRAFAQGRLTGLEFETIFLSVFRAEGDQFRSDWEKLCVFSLTLSRVTVTTPLCESPAIWMRVVSARQPPNSWRSPIVQSS